jgi:hypothetical protein
MCNVFEDGLAKFLKSLAEKDVKPTIPEHVRDDADRAKEKPTRKRCRRRTVVDKPAAKEQQKAGVTSDEGMDTSAATMSESKATKRKFSDEEGMNGGREVKKIMNVDHVDATQGSIQEAEPPHEQEDLLTPGTEDAAGKDTSGKGLEGRDLAQPSHADGSRDTIMCMGPLKLLNCYGSGSTCSIEASEAVTKRNNKKVVSFADQLIDSSCHTQASTPMDQAVSRPVTRSSSMSPKKQQLVVTRTTWRGRK